MSNNDIVQKLWNLCDVLRDDGINYSDYVTELVLLLFIKMVHENTEAGILNQHRLPEGCRWPDLRDRSGLNLLNHYRQMLLNLGRDTDPLIAAIYADAQTSLREPRHLEQLIKSLDAIDWFSAAKDGLGDLYEGLLEKNASETKSGAGQYFTPRPLIDSIIRCVDPWAGEVIQDPAAGTAGFLIAADARIKRETDDLYDLDNKAATFQRTRAFVGMELVPNTRRLALMNCLLHGMEGDDEGVVHLGNTLGLHGTRLPCADLILTNPPFGTAKGGGGPTRDDFTYKTSNKQLAFLQHIVRSLKRGGRAAVVLPDNVLFEAGVGTERTPFGHQHLKPFESVYGDQSDGTGPRTEGEWSFTDAEAEQNNDNSRWRCFSREHIRDQKGDSLDISWIKDEDSVDAASLPEPNVLAAEAMGELTEALRELDGLMQALGAGEQAEVQRKLLVDALGVGVEECE